MVTEEMNHEPAKDALGTLNTGEVSPDEESFAEYMERRLAEKLKQQGIKDFVVEEPEQVVVLHKKNIILKAHTAIAEIFQKPEKETFIITVSRHLGDLKLDNKIALKGIEFLEELTNALYNTPEKWTQESRRKLRETLRGTEITDSHEQEEAGVDMSVIDETFTELGLDDFRKWIDSDDFVEGEWAPKETARDIFDVFADISKYKREINNPTEMENILMSEYDRFAERMKEILPYEMYIYLLKFTTVDITILEEPDETGKKYIIELFPPLDPPNAEKCLDTFEKAFAKYCVPLFRRNVRDKHSPGIIGLRYNMHPSCYVDNYNKRIREIGPEAYIMYKQQEKQGTGNICASNPPGMLELKRAQYQMVYPTDSPELPECLVDHEAIIFGNERVKTNVDIGRRGSNHLIIRNPSNKRTPKTLVANNIAKRMTSFLPHMRIQKISCIDFVHRLGEIYAENRKRKKINQTYNLGKEETEPQKSARIDILVTRIEAIQEELEGDMFIIENIEHLERKPTMWKNLYQIISGKKKKVIFLSDKNIVDFAPMDEKYEVPPLPIFLEAAMSTEIKQPAQESRGEALCLELKQIGYIPTGSSKRLIERIGEIMENCDLYSQLATAILVKMKIKPENKTPKGIINTEFTEDDARGILESSGKVRYNLAPSDIEDPIKKHVDDHHIYHLWPATERNKLTRKYIAYFRYHSFKMRQEDIAEVWGLSSSTIGKYIKEAKNNIPILSEIEHLLEKERKKMIINLLKFPQ